MKNSAILHDSAVLADLKRRLDALRPDAPRRWGTMSVDQMLSGREWSRLQAKHFDHHLTQFGA
jgi:hypothetical protein